MMKAKLSLIQTDSSAGKTTNPGRKLKGSWIYAFMEEVASTCSPEIFRLWAGIAAVSGALERKVRMKSRYSYQYPNLYVVLVGPPGVGKTEAINPVRTLWKALKQVHVASSNVSRASFIDQLNRATRILVNHAANPPTVSFNSLLVASNELGTFLSAYESDFMSILQDLFDCKWFEEEKRTNDLKIAIDNPHLTLLAGTTPSYLNGLFAEVAWDQGFTSRTVFVYSGEIILGDIFIADEAKQNDALVDDLKTINNLQGTYVWEPEAADTITAWYKAGGPPIPKHPRLLHYTTRRLVIMLKLSMIAAAADSNELVVRARHYQQALDWLIMTEASMPEIFKAGMGADSKIMDDCWHFAFDFTLKKNTLVHEQSILAFLSQKAPIHSVERLLEMMIKTNRLKKHVKKEGVFYEPRAD